MSNLVLETYLSKSNINLIRTDVGDQHVAAAMRAHLASLGGEQSGHIIIGNKNYTGDGILAALFMCKILTESNKRASEIFNVFTPYPQIIKSIRVDKSVLNSKEVISAIARIKEDLSVSGGRVLVRPSGTEPLIRIMAEAKDLKMAQQAIDSLANHINDHKQV